MRNGETVDIEQGRRSLRRFRNGVIGFGMLTTALVAGGTVYAVHESNAQERDTTTCEATHPGQKQYCEDQVGHSGGIFLGEYVAIGSGIVEVFGLIAGPIEYDWKKIRLEAAAEAQAASSSS